MASHQPTATERMKEAETRRVREPRAVDMICRRRVLARRTSGRATVDDALRLDTSGDIVVSLSTRLQRGHIVRGVGEDQPGQVNPEDEHDSIPDPGQRVAFRALRRPRITAHDTLPEGVGWRSPPGLTRRWRGASTPGPKVGPTSPPGRA
jgi:hypothetical protein